MADPEDEYDIGASAPAAHAAVVASPRRSIEEDAAIRGDTWGSPTASRVEDNDLASAVEKDKIIACVQLAAVLGTLRVG